MTEPIKQPEALRLADALAERRVTQWVHSTGEMPRADGYRVDVECFEAAIELRRQHDKIEMLQADHAEDQSVIAVWRGRTQRAEAECNALRVSSDARIFAETYTRLDAQAAKLIAEVERLRAELDRRTTLNPTKEMLGWTPKEPK
jgi:hypothetical protein